MTAKNDITGDEIKTKTITDSYRDNYDIIFRKDKLKQKEDNEKFEKSILKDEYYDLD